MDIEESSDNSTFRPHSTWMPPKDRNQTLEIYIKAIRGDTEKLLTAAKKRRTKDNLTHEERQALKHLRRHDDIVIKPADKGSAIVVQSKVDYIHEAERQLSNSTCYRKLTKDPTPDIIREVKKAVNLMYNNETIDKWTMRYLTPNHIRTAKFYLLRKIHKPGNPGRPIVSSTGSPTENFSHFVDYHLRPLVTALPSHIQDTTHFLSKLLKLPSLPQNTLLVTLDVTSIYTNIPHEEGTRACEEILDTWPSQDPPQRNYAI